MDRVRIGTKLAQVSAMNARQWAGVERVEKRVFAFAGTRYLNRFSLGRQYFTCITRTCPPAAPGQAIARDARSGPVDNSLGLPVWR